MVIPDGVMYHKGSLWFYNIINSSDLCGRSAFIRINNQIHHNL